jgi:hypothetical protein
VVGALDCNGLRCWSYNLRKGGTMRIPGLLVALLFGMVSLGAAPASDSTAEANPVSHFHPAIERHHFDLRPLGPSIGRRHFDLHNLGSIHIDDDRDKVCYTMRSYIVAQEDRDSDSTKLVGYSTCQPSSRYELRITVEDPKE